MEVGQVVSIVERVAGTDASCADRALLQAQLGDVQRLAAWVESRRLALVALVERLASFPEDVIGVATRTSHRDAARTLERAHVAADVPVFAVALAAGQVSAAHLDVLGDGLRRLDVAERPALDTDRLAEVARRTTPEEFRRAVHREVDSLRRDAGMERLERQRRDTRLRTWVARDGMWHLAGRFDPATGLSLAGRLRNELERRFADEAPDTCPADPLEKQDHLRALALVSLTEGNGGSGAPEILVVRDERCAACPTCNPPPSSPPPAPPTSPGGPGVGDGPPARSQTRTQAPLVGGEGPADAGSDHPPTSRPAGIIDWGLDVDLPAAYLDELARRGRTYEVVVRNGVVQDSTGVLAQGRSTRLANRAQRRALRGLYPTCAIPGCAVRFWATRIHHVVWWEHGGTTDLENLVPLCSRHHHAVHDQSWRLALARDRTLRVELPDGTVMTTGPPRRAAA